MDIYMDIRKKPKKRSRKTKSSTQEKERKLSPREIAEEFYWKFRNHSDPRITKRTANEKWYHHGRKIVIYGIQTYGETPKNLIWGFMIEGNHFGRAKAFSTRMAKVNEVARWVESYSREILYKEHGFYDINHCD